MVTSHTKLGSVNDGVKPVTLENSSALRAAFTRLNDTRQFSAPSQSPSVTGYDDDAYVDCPYDDFDDS